MNSFIYVVSRSAVDFLFANGFDCLQEHELNNQTIYIFPNGQEIIRLLNSKYSKKDYCFGKRLFF